MNFTDIIALAWRNLRQAKLRTALTVMGVVIGVAAIITMVSFGMGLQQNIIANTLSKLDLFTVITVFGRSADELLAMSGGALPNERTAANEGSGAGKSAPAEAEEPGAGPDARRRVLDDEAIAEMQRFAGVKYAQPIVVFQSYVRYQGRVERHRIRGAAAAVERTPRFKKFLAGQTFSSDEAQEVVVTEQFLRRFGARFRTDRRGRRADNRGPFRPSPTKSEAERAEEAKQVLGREVVLLTLRQADAAPTSVFGIPLLDLTADDSGEPEADSDDRFERHSFRIAGVLVTESGVLNIDPQEAEIFVPLAQAKRFREANRDPMERMGAALAGDPGYPRAEVRVTDPTQVRAVQDEIRKLGFNSFSLTNQADEIRQVFLILNGGLALLGGIALLVASFGIANTMIMSILERRREIGIMKAIGGSDGEIMRIFFFEASLIGLAGGVFGVLSGWGVDRIANFTVNRWVVKQTPPIQFFSIPWYLWAGAIVFAVLISLLAAIYPALRAARVDPIKALRHD
jgi:putative ABC transport system permease protein